jgi:hypothetical protein
VIYGPVVTTVFSKYLKNKSIQLQTAYANQYSGSGDQTLVDGQIGGDDYRGTEWQGFQGTNVDALITLDEQQQISKVVVSCLQDTKSWIFHPKAMTIEISTDGVNYKKAGTIQNTKVSDRLEGAASHRFTIDFPPVTAKYIRIRVENYGVCPDWHLGAGGATWLFLDEIQVD